jgi:hypothetical protein
MPNLSDKSLYERSQGMQFLNRSIDFEPPHTAPTFAAMFARARAMAFGEPAVGPFAYPLPPVLPHFGIVPMPDPRIPPCLDEWFRQTARMAG